MLRNWLFIFLIAAGAVSCDSNRVFDDYKSLPDGWPIDEPVVFTLSGPDTLQPYNLFINIRNNHEFEFSNLFLIAQIKFPQGLVVTDTLEYNMAAPTGEWLGTGFGNIVENKLWYKEQVRFTEPGDYDVVIKHAMRRYNNEEGIQNLKGIIEVGFRVENTKN